MDKSWDAWVPPPELWHEVLRVLKPGGHALVFASSRTQDLMSISLRLAGFEIRDTLQWLYGSGFPKSHNVEKSTGDAQWAGWGTALKPAYEPVILIRKPFESTVADNVLEHGTGVINIDACRVGDDARVNPRARNKAGGNSLGLSERGMPQDAQASECVGRWPSNVILDEEIADLLSDKQRFFYCAKASKTEREAGLAGSVGFEHTPRANTHPTVKPLDLMRYLVRLITPPNGLILDPFAGSGSTLCACVSEGFRVVGIEREPEYVEIARARLAHWTHEAKSEETKIGDQLNLFAALDKL
jgi:site-specific DNA-methyltransferase (adenine-specific)